MTQLNLPLDMEGTDDLAVGDTSQLRVIGIAGKAGHGKDTVATFLQEIFGENPSFLPKPTRGTLVSHFAKPIKDVMKIVFGLDDEDLYTQEGKKRVLEPYDMTIRKIAQIVGTEMFRDMIHKDIWLHALYRNISSYPEYLHIIPDVRFKNEAEFLRKNTQCRIIEIRRPDLEDVTQSNHASERIDVDPDLIIYNRSNLSDLYAHVKNVVEHRFI